LAVYTVSQVTAYLRESLELDPFLGDLYVMGEVSNLRVSAAGHSYFTLKDGQAVLNCVMFKGQPGANLLQAGAAVSTHGRMSFYEPRGSTDFMVDLVMAEGAGELALELERLRLRLEAEGLFDPTRKRPLPPFPRVVGVVTSPSGAVFHDIQNVIRRRYPLVELLLSPTQVQGDAATLNIVAAIEALNAEGRSDVIIVARGGGSLEELWPFNEEAVARAIYASRIPVVSAVGHETDYTIADLVADVRAPTPSAAAELVVPSGVALRQDLRDQVERAWRVMMYLTEQRRQQVVNLERRLERSLPDLDIWRRRVDDLGRTAHHSLAGRLALTRVEVTGVEHRLRALDPAATMRRGYAVVQRAEDQQVVSSTSQVSAGDTLSITVADGVVPATVDASTGGGANSSGLAHANGRTRPSDRKSKGRSSPAGMERLL
jgi:exodeoxyribonuclease VII large subunit